VLFNASIFTVLLPGNMTKNGVTGRYI